MFAYVRLCPPKNCENQLELGPSNRGLGRASRSYEELGGPKKCKNILKSLCLLCVLLFKDLVFFVSFGMFRVFSGQNERSALA